MKPEAKKTKTGYVKAHKSAARLLAVQAVFQMLSNQQKAKDLVPEFLEHRAGMEVDGDEMVSPDHEHFKTLVLGVEENLKQLQEMVLLNRSKKTNEERAKTELLLQAIFLCGSFELMVLQTIDFPIIIADYLHVAHAFYDDSEAKLVNALLDSVRQTVR